MHSGNTLPNMRMSCLFLLLLFGCLAATGLAQMPFQNPNASRVDVKGDTIDVHDGRVTKFGDRYYWYGTAYGNTSGFTRSNEYRVYSSPDLVNWTAHGAVLPNPPSGIYYRPHVIYHPGRKEYVLWFNWYSKLWTGRFGVATSKSPTGPFQIVSTEVNVAHAKLGVGDFNLFVDDDGTAYLMYNTIQVHKHSVERLKYDFLSSTLDNGGFIAESCEAGSVFRRDSLYYLLTDITCCFCTQGSGARVYTSTNPLRGYALRQNINRFPGRAAPMLTDGDLRPNVYHSLRRDTATGQFAPIEIWFADDASLSGLRMQQYTGNRQGTCGDTVSTKTHEPRLAPEFRVSYHVDGVWMSAPAASPNSQRRTLSNVIELRHSLLRADAVRIEFAAEYPYNQLQLVEVEPLLQSGTALAARDGAYAYVLDENPMYTAPIVPAQQTFVMPIKAADDSASFVWMGDLWGSAPENIKGHDVQYWSAPLKFYSNGLIRPLRW